MAHLRAQPPVLPYFTHAPMDTQTRGTTHQCGLSTEQLAHMLEREGPAALEERAHARAPQVAPPSASQRASGVPPRSFHNSVRCLNWVAACKGEGGSHSAMASGAGQCRRERRRGSCRRLWGNPPAACTGIFHRMPTSCAWVQADTRSVGVQAYQVHWWSRVDAYRLSQVAQSWSRLQRRRIGSLMAEGIIGVYAHVNENSVQNWGHLPYCPGAASTRASALAC